jgi:Tol biopolymer transport system component/DNA-binding winged helix-turn-helix (wHTH) protein
MKYRWDDFLLDLDSFRLERGGAPLSLEPKAFNLLVLLVQRPGHVFTKQELFEQLWPNTAVTDHALTRVIAQLRRVLGDEARDGRYIETVPTRGYRWLPAVESIDQHEPAPAAAPPNVPKRSPVFFPLAASALGVVIALLAAIAWSAREHPSGGIFSAVVGPPNVPRPVQITTHAGLDLQPAFSPNGDAIAYTSDQSGAFEIYIRGLAGTSVNAPLTSDRQHNVQPAWSPDARMIAYHSHVRGGIWVMPARGGTARQIVVEGSHPAWSPDGRHIAFQSDEPADVTPTAYGAQSSATIRLVDADGRNARQLTTAGRPFGGHAAPAWSADGRFVAFTVFDGEDNGVWIATLATGEIRQLIKGIRGHYELVFAPDDSAIYVGGGDPFISRIPFDKGSGLASGDRELIAVPGVASVRGMTISPDGRALGFAGLSISSQIWAQPIAADGTGRGDPRPLTIDTSRRNSLPVLSPDGSRVAYVSTRGGEAPNLWVLDIDGRNGSQITDHDGPDLKPYWFADGRRVAFLSTRGGALGLWQIDLDTRREELLRDLRDFVTDGEAIGSVAEPALSPSLDKVALSVIVPPHANRQIFLSPANGGSAKPLSDGRQWVGYPAWSRDGRRLAVEVKDGSSTHAAVIDVETGRLTQLTRQRGQTWVWGWSPDGTKVAAAAFRDGRWSLRSIDAETGAMGVIAAPVDPRVYVRYPSWSSRGDVIVYEHGELRGNIWTLPLAGLPTTRHD